MKNLEQKPFKSRLQKITVAILCLLFIVTNATNIYSQKVSIDDTFGQGGIVTMSNRGGVEFITFDEQGNIFALGYSDFGCPTIIKTDANGIIDESFGTNGSVIIDYPSNLGRRLGFKVTNDKKIIIIFLVYNHSYIPQEHPDDGFKIIQLNEDGSIDESFGVDGKIEFDKNIGITAVNTENDEYMLIAGIEYYFDTISGEVQKPYISKFNYNGEIDKTFGNEGKVYLTGNYDRNVFPVSIKILKDKSILAAGQQISAPSNSILCKIDATGNLITSFADNGFFIKNVANNNYSESFYHIFEENDGNLLLTAGIIDSGPVWRTVICGLNSNGTLNSNFGKNGFYRSDSENANFNFQPIVLQNGNNYLLGRISKITGIKSDGTLDNDFHDNGTFALKNFSIYDMKQQTENKFIIGGRAGIIRIITSTETSIKQNHFSNSIMVFPNPVSETLYFSNETTFEIIDIKGNLMMKSNEAVNSVNVSKLGTGIYFVKVGNRVQKIIKE